MKGSVVTIKEVYQKKDVFRKMFLVLACCLTVSKPANARYEHLVHKTYSERLQVLEPFYTDTLLRYHYDSAYVWKTIDELTQLGKKYNDEDLILEAGIMRIKYFVHYSRFSVPTVLGSIQELKNEAVENKKIWAQAMLENLESGYYYQISDYELAFEHSQRLYELVKDLKVEDFPYKQLSLTAIGTRYYRFREYREALFYFLLGLQSEPTVKLDYRLNRLNLLNSTGLCYQKIGIIDSSDYYFNETYRLATSLHDTAFQGIASGNIGYDLFLKNKYDAAIPLLQKDVDIAEYRHDYGLASGSLLVLGNISLVRGNIVMAEQQLLAAKELIFRSKQFSRLEQAYPLLTKLYIAKHEPAKANVYMDSSFYWRDSMATQFDGQRILRAKQKKELEYINTEWKRADDRRRAYKVQRNMLIIFIIVVAAGAIYFYRLRRKKNQLQETLLKKKEQELATATRQLDDFAKHMSEKNEIIEFLETQNNLENNDTLEKLHKSTILTDDDWIYYRELFEKVYPGFFERLSKKIPGLTPAETRFMALSKLKLTGKEMAKILGVGTDAIRQYRSRVRKKLQLGDDDLEELTLNI